MDWKYFFKLDITKIILTVTIFLLIIVFPTYGNYYGRTCPINEHCEPELGFVFFGGFYFLGSIFQVKTLFSLMVMFISITLLSYALSCSLTYIYKTKK